MSRLYIAEKPSLGRAIAAVLPKPHKNEQGYIKLGNGDIVTWCVGHLLEQVEPDAYDERYKKWSLADLPILPEQWQLKPRSSASKQLSVIRKLVKSANEIVHAGDPDREGQLLVDEVIDYLKVPQTKKRSAKRLLISDLNPPAVKRALNQLRDNSEFVPLSVSALARSRADWVYGMNMSRAYTLLGKQAGYNGVLSVGRVQTPVLGLVVRRDDEIANFVPKAYFELDALIPYEGADIKARWQPSEACQPYQDEEGRVILRSLVENVQRRIANQPAEVVESDRKISKQSAPLPYSLSALQIDAAKRFQMSAADVLAVCQSLYEKHKLITYPRSDCRYLPLDHYQQRQSVMDAIANNSSELSSGVHQADMSLKSKAWNDKKVDAHHAIIPTPKQLKSAQISGREAQIYGLIARQYVMQFYPAAEYNDAKLVFEIGGGRFIAKGRSLKNPGWKALLGKAQQDDEVIDALVPPLTKGTVLTCREGVILDKMTEPPRHFTEATLLQAMTGIARFVADKSLKKILRDTDGLGTEATRAGILDTLFKRQLLSRQGKTIRATEAGRGLIYALPELAVYPDMTAHWEHQLQDIAEKRGAYQPFMAALTTQIGEFMHTAQHDAVPASLYSLPEVKRPAFKKRNRKGTTKASTRGKSKPKAK
ncbi:DNA topoisomerase III [Thaumasiovibrio subtropicus]|uniref:DNA topoisomerase III n=1 Tax=Thaumasiovibrio subtropicus TaxID=1891207 RepID=UPI000B35E4A8|nr:DNA topoisomerase III [Thaumasiovibrio subtropicus]